MTTLLHLISTKFVETSITTVVVVGEFGGIYIKLLECSAIVAEIIPPPEYRPWRFNKDS